MIDLNREGVLAVFLVLCVALLVQVIYYLFTYSRFAFYQPKKENSTQWPVSVIICGRNEVRNFKLWLRNVLEQDYSDYEVVVVNDCSWDESNVYLEELEKQYKHLKVVTLKE